MSTDGRDIVFLFSLPRSGSTLTQRMVAAHPEIATASEPSILLPFLYSIRDRGVYAEYGHFTTAQAIQDFCDQLPSGRAAYLAEIRALAIHLYAQARGDRRYFLDKTPRYHLIADELLRLFPAAKAIFLWRQPLAVAASIIDTFGDGRWNLDKYSIDLYDGLDRLLATEREHRQRSLAIRYEDLLADPGGTHSLIAEYLDLPTDHDAGSYSVVQLRGRAGDQSGQAYSEIVSDPTRKWLKSMANPVRKRWCFRYLRWLGPRLDQMGYDRGTIESQLRGIDISAHNVVSDLGRISLGYGYWRIADRLTKSPPRGLAALPAHQSSAE